MTTAPPLRSILAALALLAAHAPAQSTIAPDKSTAHAANAGTIDLAPSTADGVVVGERFLSGHAYSANLGWISFGDGSPANGHTYTNSLRNAADFGVNHDGAGNLTGFAYGANFGWINFGWTTANDPDRPRFDLLTGTFSGYAYSANTAWINLAAYPLVVASIDCPDTDRDGLGDAWEYQHFGDLRSTDGRADHDHDGRSDLAEYTADTDPDDPADRFDLELVDVRPAGNRFDPLHRITFNFASSPTRLYQLWTSPDLERFTQASDAGTITPDPGDTTTVEYTTDAADRRFVSVRPVRPLKSTTPPR